MATIVKKNFEVPEETRPIDKGKVEVVDLGSTKAMRVTFEPGWRWSECIKPLAGTESCQVGHLVYVLSGRMVIRMDDGSQTELGPGDVGVIPPGHDAWVTGDEPCVSIDFQGAATYAKPST
ncbi:MAG: cupin domain-containing protein [Verrucomicrobia bacterium]|nr:cupin domain-containing protein [Verrucomicrobiota bacterium]